MYWDIPYINQFGYAKGLQDDPLGCWYACVCMQGYAFGVGPRRGVPQLYDYRFSLYGVEGIGHYPIDMLPAQNDGVGSAILKTLMKSEQLQKMMAPKTWSYSAGKIASILKNFGPLIVTHANPVGRSGRSYSHCSVLIGVQDTMNLIVHEPSVRKHMIIPIHGYFNNALSGYPIFRKNQPIKLIRSSWHGGNNLVQYEDDWIEYGH